MNSDTAMSRRTFVAATAAAGVGSLSGCTGDGVDGAASSPAATETDARDATASGTATGDAGSASELVGAVEREAVSFELAASSDGLDAVAGTLAGSPIVGLGEHSHGVGEFKAGARHLVQRLVADHGYRLIAAEGTLGEFDPVDAYVAGRRDDVESALAGLRFHFWKTPEVGKLFEWLGEFNDGRPESDRVVVRGYDAQYYDVNAQAVQRYLERVDPEYLAEVEDSLAPLARPHETNAEPKFATDDQLSLLSKLRDRLEARESEYVAASSRSAWELARRHLWTLERGLRFRAKYADRRFAAGKEVRDRAMAENVGWLREWSGRDRAVVLGSVNHTGRGSTKADGRGTRMGQHLTDEFGDDYYSLGLTFGTGSFAAPTNRRRTEFETFDLAGPVDGTMEATLAEAGTPRYFLDFESARERSRIDAWLDETSEMQVSFPSEPERGAVAFPEPPAETVDGAFFVEEASAAAFADYGRGTDGEGSSGETATE